MASLLVGRANEQISHIFHSEFPVMICISTTSSSGWKTGSSQNFHSHWQCVEHTGTLESGKQAVERFLERVILLWSLLQTWWGCVGVLNSGGGPVMVLKMWHVPEAPQVEAVMQPVHCADIQL